MLTTDSGIDIELDDYVFKSSPSTDSAFSDNSSSPDYINFPADEDFLQQLSSDLDIPLLLNNEEEDMSLLNSIFDRSADELLSEISSASPSSFHGQDHDDNHVSEKPVELPSCGDVQIKNERLSPRPLNIALNNDDNNKSVNVKSSNLLLNSVTNQDHNYNAVYRSPPKKLKLSPVQNFTRKIPIQPKGVNILASQKNVVVVNTTSNFNGTATTVTSVQPKILLVEPVPNIEAFRNVSATPRLSQPVILASPPPNIYDQKLLKKQQRKIKNRESACLSRKKKKDYLGLLEARVNELTEENGALRNENLKLKMRLSQFETYKPCTEKVQLNIPSKMAVCAFLLVVGVNLSFLRLPMNNLNRQVDETPLSNHVTRRLLWNDEGEPPNIQNSTSNFLPFSMCPAINQSESARLVLELERWIGKPNNFSSTKWNARPVVSTPKHKYPRRRRINLESNFVSSVFDGSRRIKTRYPKLDSSTNELQVFAPTMEQMYSEFFQAINRQEDTFYVVSFSDHHMLLPALQHNRTTRPKMSLIMPSVIPSNLTQPSMVPLMQIDCEVLDTRLIHVKYGIIPQHLRNQGNTTAGASVPKSRSQKDNATQKYANKKRYRPYFVNHTTPLDEKNLKMYDVN